jgi:phage shock protein A
MSILNRFSDVVKSNINALIDRAEDPEKMANQIILDLEKIQKEVTEGVAVSIAEEKRLKNLVEQNRAEVSRWESRAMDALKRGEEDMAREAIAQKQKFEGDYETYLQQYEKQVADVQMLKNNLIQLREKIEEARRRRDNLAARSNSAKTQANVAKATGTASALDAMGKLDKMERKVEQQAGMAEAYLELNATDNVESKFEHIEKEKSVDDELAALREKMNSVEES